MKVVEGQFPLSENPGAARHWAGEDGVPRPDLKYNWLLILSIVGGVIGADHFYLRSPKTGFLKMLTIGGFGLWWLWDVAQILFEKARILNYGLMGPLDLTTGIGQGMITDQQTNYKSNSSYGLWTWSTMFGFLGLDSFFVTKNMGQGMRKFLEGALLLGSLSGLLTLGVVGLPHGFFAKIGAIIGGLISLFGAVIFGTMVGVQWFVTLKNAMEPPDNLFRDGIKLSEADDKQLNALVLWLMGNADFPKERKEQIIQDLKYGSMMPERVRAMFKIYHPSEGSPVLPPATDSKEGNPGSLASFFSYLGSPINIWWLWVRTGFWLAKEGIASVNQPAYSIGKIMEMFTKFISPEMLQQIASPANVKGMVAGAVESMPMVGKPLAAAFEGKPLGQVVADAGANAVGQVQGAVAGKAAEMVGTAKGLGEAAGAATKVLGKAAGTVGGLREAADAATNVLGVANGLGEAVGAATKVLGEAAGAAVAKRMDPLGVASLNSIPTVPIGKQAGGARSESLSLESKVMGAAAAALIGGGALKFLIDNLMAE